MKPKYATIKAKDLKRDDWFIIIGKRKERWVSKVLDLVHPTEGRIILVFSDQCRQIKFKPDEDVYWVKTSEDMLIGYYRKHLSWYENEVVTLKKKLLETNFSTPNLSYLDSRENIEFNIKQHEEKINLVKNNKTNE